MCTTGMNVVVHGVMEAAPGDGCRCFLMIDADAAPCLDEIEVLVDLSGHTAGSRLTVFAHRHALVPVSWPQ